MSRAHPRPNKLESLGWGQIYVCENHWTRRIKINSTEGKSHYNQCEWVKFPNWKTELNKITELQLFFIFQVSCLVLILFANSLWIWDCCTNTVLLGLHWEAKNSWVCARSLSKTFTTSLFFYCGHVLSPELITMIRDFGQANVTGIHTPCPKSGVESLFPEWPGMRVV